MEQDPWGSKLGRVKKKKNLFISNNKFFFQVALGVEGREGLWSESGAGGCELRS